MSQILAMVLGAVPFLKRLIFTADAPLFFFTDSCIILGYTQLYPITPKGFCEYVFSGSDNGLLDLKFFQNMEGFLMDTCFGLWFDCYYVRTLI